MADKDIILEVRDLKKYFKSPTGTLHAVDGVNFSIRRGETLGLVGETGAGKSIVVDALNAVLGGRTSRDLIRTGAKSALVSAQFIDLPQLDWFQEQGIAQDAEGVLLLQRELRADGKNTCRLNGRPVSLAQLRELGRQLLDIHGQHDGQRLLDPACHLEYLDSFGQCSPLLADYQTAYHKLTSLKKQMDSLKMDETEKTRRVDNLTYQIAEMERADLRPGEDEALAERKKLLRSAGKIMGAVDSACYALFGSDETQGALDLVEEAADAMRQAGRYSDAFGELAEKLESLRYDLDDAAECVRDKREEMEFSPSELDQLESRLDNNALVQEGESPAEDPMELLRELEEDYAQLEELIARINRTNSTTEAGEGRTLSDLLARRECMTGRLRILRDFLNSASAVVNRRTVGEIRIRSAVNVRELQKQVDRDAKALRELDETIQEKNWTTELVEL